MASKQNFTIEQRATFKRTLIWRSKLKRPINLTGYTARLQIRASAADPTVLLELSTSNGRIIITPLAGKIELIVSDEDTSLLTFKSGVYDLKLFAPDGTSYRLLEGKILISEGVTE